MEEQGERQEAFDGGMVEDRGIHLEAAYHQGDDVKVGVHTFTVVNATGELLTLKVKELIPGEKIGGV